MKTHGSRVTRGHGMRSGISLIEMLMAIVLLGVLSTVGFKYYKIYYDTTFAAKQAKVYILIDQAQQLSGAHDLYETKNAKLPANVAALVLDKQLIAAPSVMPEVSATGWVLLTPAGTVVDIDGGTTPDNDIGFVIDVDTTTGTIQDKLDYCNIVTNTGTNTWSLNTVDADVQSGADRAAAITVGGQDTAGTYDDDMFCVRSAASTYHLVFTKLRDPA